MIILYTTHVTIWYTTHVTIWYNLGIINTIEPSHCLPSQYFMRPLFTFDAPLSPYNFQLLYLFLFIINPRFSLLLVIS